MSAAAIAWCIPSPRFKDEAVHVATVERVLKRKRTFGHVRDNLHAPRARLMSLEHWLIVAEVVKKKPFLYLCEIAAAVDERCGKLYAMNIISKELRRHQYSRKEMRRQARQRNNYKRYLYHKEVAEYMEHPSQLCFADEVGQDGRGSQRRRGWGPKGEDIVITEYLNRGVHISVLALYGYEGFLAFDWKEGGYDGGAFLSAVELTICPHLQRYVKGHPKPNSIFIIDNCPAHKKYEKELRELVEGRRGAKLLFLAPYSPIDNPIEMAFNCFKACWRRHGMWLTALPMHDRIYFCITNCYIDPKAAAVHTYAACGYS